MTGQDLVVLSLFPELMNVHGDAGNAAVLATRLNWAGRAARVVDVRIGNGVPTAAPSIVVIGSGFDADARTVAKVLRALEPALRDWHAASVPVFAVGTGWELLAAEVELDDGTVDGIGLFGGRSTKAATRANGEVVVESDFGDLVGYEYHLRDYALGAGETPLGRVVTGVGNSAASGLEGAISGNFFGTHLAGPVLARNPRLADHMISLAIGEAFAAEAGGGLADAPVARVDGWAAAVNARVRRG